MSAKHSFPAVVDTHVRTLILGSLPGDRSLLQQQYYAHPQNKFWTLMGDVIGVELLSLDYPARLATLLAHQIGLWDVIANAQRVGSLDSDIRAHRSNDLLALLDTLPELKTIAFNGATAAKIGMKILGARASHFRTLLLPSSSPAHATLSYVQKREKWCQLALNHDQIET